MSDAVHCRLEASVPGNNDDLDVMIQMLGPQYEPVETYTLYGAWPQNIDGGDLNMSSADVAKLNVTFRFDYAILNSDY